MDKVWREVLYSRLSSEDLVNKSSIGGEDSIPQGFWERKDFIKEDYHFINELAINDVPIQIVVGSNTGKFVPNINMSKWNDEAWLNINYPQTVTNELPVFIDGKISQKIGDLTHRYYPKDNDVLEEEIILDQKPSTNELVFNIDFPEGLEFWYQDSLENEYEKLTNPSFTLAEFLAMTNRPPNVVGSYAVYWKEMNNEKKTGKFCHLFAWEATDALGAKQHIPLNIDPVLKKLTLAIDQTYLDNATYPVKLMGMGDTLGYSSKGASLLGTAYYYQVYKGTTNAGGGNTAQIHCWCKNTSGASAYDIYMNMYDSDGTRPENLLRATVSTSVAASFDGQKDIAYVTALAGSTDYWVAWTPFNDAVDLYYDTSGGTNARADWGIVNNEFVDPWLHTDDDWSTYRWSIWVDYAAGGGNVALLLFETSGSGSLGGNANPMS